MYSHFSRFSRFSRSSGNPAPESCRNVDGDTWCKRALRVPSRRESALTPASTFVLTPGRNILNSHQASASASTLASKFKRVLDRSKSINASANADTRREHGLYHPPPPPPPTRTNHSIFAQLTALISRLSPM